MIFSSKVAWRRKLYRNSHTISKSLILRLYLNKLYCKIALHGFFHIIIFNIETATKLECAHYEEFPKRILYTDYCQQTNTYYVFSA